MAWQHCTWRAALPALRHRERRVKPFFPDEAPQTGHIYLTSGIGEGGISHDPTYGGLIMHGEGHKTSNMLQGSCEPFILLRNRCLLVFKKQLRSDLAHFDLQYLVI